ncbi:4287_t:CDS:2 [Ambispora leptoticha]|uniref:4287_t:CDS:1 n=1 Tax=Ambispora leptoticha TaxID=144679 RepID=A0A9N9DIV5_9GLOM|nr:4287_t:CDS:2 [Ambispora leptoticha]
MDVKSFEEIFDNDFLRLFNDSDDHDVIINVGKEPNSKTFSAHAVILCARSPYFSEELSSASVANKKWTLSIRNVMEREFAIILKYIYTGILEVDNADTYELLLASCELKLHPLIDFLQGKIIQESSDWLSQKLIPMYHTAVKLAACKKLRSFCIEQIYCRPELVFDSPDFVTISEDLLVTLLNRDDLTLPEVKIWQLVIMWTLYRHPDISKNPESWTDDSVNLLQNTIGRCIPHIRFFSISGDDYMDKVRPYKKLLPRELKTDIENYHICSETPVKSVTLPPRKPRNNTILPNQNHNFS